MLKTSSKTKISRMLSGVRSILKSAYLCAEIDKKRPSNMLPWLQKV